MSHAERCHYDVFIEKLVAQSITTLQTYSSNSTASSSSGGGSSLPPVVYPSSSRSSSAGSRSRSDSGVAAVSLNSPVMPAHLAATAYGMAVLGARSEQLAAAVVEASARLLAQAADATAGGMSSSGQDAGVSGSSSSAAGESSTPAGAAAGGIGVWGPGEVSSLMWGLGTVGYSPPAEWLQDMQAVSRELMPR